MNQGSSNQPGSRRSAQFIALLGIVGVALAASALVTWLAVTTGLELWVFLLLVVTVPVIVLALVD